ATMEHLEEQCQRSEKIACRTEGHLANIVDLLSAEGGRLKDMVKRKRGDEDEEGAEGFSRDEKRWCIGEEKGYEEDNEATHEGEAEPSESGAEPEEQEALAGRDNSVDREMAKPAETDESVVEKHFLLVLVLFFVFLMFLYCY
ncbi:hypothetical protein KEM55_006348, partial [Ascosphaera atra]